MPRPRNTMLDTLVERTEGNQVFCRKGNCNGKRLNAHSGNIERHLKMVHPDIYATYIQQKMAMQRKRASTSSTATTSTRNSNSNSNNIVNVTVPKCKPRVTNIELAIVELFTKCKQPLNILEERAFQIIAGPAFQSLGIGVNRQSVLDLITSCSQKLKTELIDDLSGNLFSLKIDIATKHDITLLGINVQYIKDRNINLKSLAIKELQIGYTSEYVKSVLIEVLIEYSVDLHQILSISTGNDVNIVDAVKGLNDELRNSLGEEAAVSNKSVKKEEGSTSSFEEWLEFNEADYLTYKIAYVRSGAHILQLCMEEIFQKPEFKLRLEKCKAILKELRSQTSFSTNANENQVTTDWIATYDMLQRLLELKEMIVPLGSKNNYLYLNCEEWHFVKEFVEICKPIYKCAKRFQAEQLCYSELFVILMEIIFELEKVGSNHLAKSLIGALNCQKLNLLDIDLFNAAVFLDPRIRVCLDTTQKTRAKQYITTLHNRMGSLKGESTNSEANESFLVELAVEEQPSTSNSGTSATAKSFCEFLQYLDTDSSSTPHSYLETDIAMYERQPRLPLSSNIIDFWYYQHNTLADIARIILAIPCTEVSIGSLSSAVDYILSDKHNRLSASNIDHILRVKANGTFNYEE
ncbi:uncharacterized protein LOC118739859 [Rhagoletis pomonella]|uniref:uncharacterized protein LOC118739859 n=1 Tax=Rhagoletis pomonella TaxID=28610 RepID=UPI0017803245|nr:uncharacterized protein LOC118739859 [Rhagoletis pomonella]